MKKVSRLHADLVPAHRNIIESLMDRQAYLTQLINQYLSHINHPTIAHRSYVLMVSMAFLQACSSGGSSDPSGSVTGFGSLITGTNNSEELNFQNLQSGQSFNLLDGTDTLTATSFDDTINAGAGDDIVRALGGNDTVNGGDGNDSLIGGAGNDTINGDAGNDIIYGGLGADQLSGGAGDDIFVLLGTTDANQYQQSDIDAPRGLSAFNISSVIDLSELNGRTVSDVQSGETISGGGGNDTLIVFGNIDLSQVSIDPAITTLIINSDVTLTSQQASSLSTIIGAPNTGTVPIIRVILNPDETSSSFDIPAIGTSNTQQTQINLNIAQNVTATTTNLDNFNRDFASVTGEGSINFMVAALGSGSITSPVIDSRISLQHNNADANLLDVAQGQVLNFASNAVNALGGVTFGDINGVNTLNLTNGGDIINLAADNDNLTINSLSGDDTITTGAGVDIINSGAGNDTINSGDNDDVITASNGDDTVNGGAGDDTINGGSGNDTLSGAAGNDIIFGDDGNDTIDGGDGVDKITVSSGDNILSGNAGDDIIRGGSGIDTINGDSGDDVIRAGSAADIINGGSGHDLIILVGDTSRESYSSADLLLFYDHDNDSSTANKTIDLANEKIVLQSEVIGDNRQTISDFVIGETIDGGDGYDTLVIYGNVQLNSDNLDINNIKNIENIILNSDLEITTSAAKILNNANIKITGSSESNITLLQDISDKDTSNMANSTIAVSDLNFISNIGSLKIDDNVTLDITDTAKLDTIFSATTRQIDGGGTLNLVVNNFTDLDTNSTIDLKNLFVNETIELIATDSTQQTSNILETNANNINVVEYQDKQTLGDDVIVGSILNDDFFLTAGFDTFTGRLGNDSYIGTIAQFGNDKNNPLTITDFSVGDRIVITDNNSGGSTSFDLGDGVFQFVLGDGSIIILDLNGENGTNTIPRDRLQFTTDSTLGQTIISYNEPPSFSDDISISIQENTTGVILKSEAIDDNPLTYTLSGDDAAFFQLASLTDPSILFASNFTPDFENFKDANNDGIYEITLVALENVSSSQTAISADQKISIEITDFNEDATFDGTFDITFNENPGAGAFINQISVNDPEDGTIVFSLRGDDADAFVIDPNTGVVTTKQDFNFENPSSSDMDNVFRVTVDAQVSFSGIVQKVTQNFSYTVANIDEIPSITSPAIFTFDENSIFDAGTVVAVDEDNNTTITYSITGGADSSDFMINPQTGSLSLASRQDFENPSDANKDRVYQLTVSATDGVTGHEQTQNISLVLQDLQEVPVLNVATVALNIPESTLVTQVIHTPLVTDPDVIDQTLTYSITGLDASLFRIDTLGRLFLRNPLDFENPADSDKNASYLIDINIADSGGNTVQQSVTLSVSDVNEAPQNGSIDRRFIESGTNISTTTFIGTLRADDPEGTAVTFSISGGSDQNIFTIINGRELNINNGSLIPQPGDTFDVEIKATDSSGNSSIFDPMVFIGGFNPTPISGTPAFISAIRENTDPSIVQRLGILDIVPGTLPGTQYLYQVIGGNNGFSVNASTGELQFSGSLDFELSPTITSNIRVIDISSNESITRNFIFDVIDENDAPRFGVNNINIIANENDATSVITTFNALEEDANDFLRYFLSGADASLFRLDAVTGDLRFFSSQNFEAPSDLNGDNQYDIQIIAVDSTGLQDSQDVTIILNDINESPSSITLSSNDVTENAPAGTIIGTLTIADPDSDVIPNGQHTIEVREGLSISNNFEVLTTLNADNSFKHELAVKSGGVVDFEISSLINNLQFFVTDLNGASNGLTLTEDNIVLKVININESVTFDDGSTKLITVVENTTGVLYKSATSDPEGDIITFSLEGSDSALFSINSVGELTSIGDLNFEVVNDANKNNVYEVTIVAVDVGMNRVEQEVLITVTDVEESPIINISNSRPNFAVGYRDADYSLNQVRVKLSDDDVSNIFESGTADTWQVIVEIVATNGSALSNTSKLVLLNDMEETIDIVNTSSIGLASDAFKDFVDDNNIETLILTSSEERVTVNFASDASLANIQNFIQAIRYDPDASDGFFRDLTVDITVTDTITSKSVSTDFDILKSIFSTIGNADDNALFATNSQEIFNGADGIDTIYYSNEAAIGAAAIQLDLTNSNLGGIGGHAQGDTFNNIERVFATSFNDTLTSTSDPLATGKYSFHGDAGADTITGGANTQDEIRFDFSDAGVTVNIENNTLSGGHATGDVISSIEDVTGSQFNDVITGSSGVNHINGLNGDDRIDAGAGDDFITGGRGDDRITGGLGDDQFYYNIDFNGNTGVERLIDGNDLYSDIMIGSNILTFDDQIAGDNTATDLSSFLAGQEINLRIILSGIEGDAGNDNIVLLLSSSDPSGGNATVSLDAGMVSANEFADTTNITWAELTAFYSNVTFDFQ